MSGKVEKAEGGMGLVGVVTRDIKLAIEIAKYGPPAPHKYSAINGGQAEMEHLIREFTLHPEWAMGWDIETPRSLAKAADESEIDSIKANILQIQFAFNSEVGYIFPGFEVDWVREGSRRLLELGNRKYTWNGWKFDDKVVASYEIHPAGENVDLMSAWSWIEPDLPKGLQFATSFAAPHLLPWKHRGQVGDEVYGACDVISLHLNADYIFKRMDEQGLRQSYDRHVSNT